MPWLACFWFRNADFALPRYSFFARDDGAFYTVHRSNALYVADVYFKTRSVVRYRGAARVPGVVVSRRLFASMVRQLLTERGCSVEVWSGSGSSWRRTQRASPGNLADFAETLRVGGADDSAAFMAVAATRHGGDLVVGVCVCNTSWRRLHVQQFVDHSELSNLEAVVTASNTQECVLSRGSAEGARLRTVLERCGLNVNVAPSRLFDAAGAGALLRRIVKKPGTPSAPQRGRASGGAGGATLTPAQSSPMAYAPGGTATAVAAEGGSTALLADLDSQPQALSAAAALLRHLDLAGNADAQGAYTLSVETLAEHMRLNASAVSSLPLFSNSFGAGSTGARKRGGTSASSIFDVLNGCSTPMGARTLRRWLLQPLCEQVEISARHDVVQVMLEDPVLMQTIRESHFRGLADVDRIVDAFERGRATLRDLLRAYRFVVALGPMAESLSCCAAAAALKADSSSEELKTRARTLATRIQRPLEQVAAEFDKFTALVETAVDLDDALDKGRVHIRASFNSELEELWKCVLAAESRATAAVAAMRLELKMDEKKLKLERNEQHGIFARVPSSHQKVLNKHRDKFIQLGVQKDGVHLTNATLRSASREYVTSLCAFEEAQSSITVQVLEIAATYTDVLRRASALVATLDTLVGFAFVASQSAAPYCRPQLCAWAGDPAGGSTPNSPVLEITAARHPCVESQAGVTFVPNDVTLRREGPRLAIITGPNMSGKSTYIRSVAALALMCQVGSFVPAESARLPVFDALLMRVGASDNQLRGVSTFMAEMLDVSAMLRTASPRSLFVVDEIGRGTSTHDGFGLAYAVAEHVAFEVQCFGLFATHFHELTRLADETQADAATPGESHSRSDGAGTGAEEHAATNSPVVNLHVSAVASGEGITMLHTVKPGKADGSFGVHVARLAGVPTDVLEVATAKLAQLESLGEDSAAHEGGHPSKRARLES